ncbi:short-subunit dehydrogenase [Bacilli bacterium PM5-3]|nr:short-subunit dehydrogenase [Bacilli bacterium PM5-3]
MNETALITGASNGIGYELSLIMASENYNLVLVARSEDKLNELKKLLENNYNIKVKVIAKDLSNQNAPLEIYEQLKEDNCKIDILVNNAGFGDHSAFYNTDWNKQNEMINLNILSLTYLTRLLLPSMIGRKSGKILNLASIASFQPGPYMSVYYASKSYVLSFSEALACELANSEVSVSAVCPGPTKTNFANAAGEGTKKLFSLMKNDTAKDVARFTYNSMMKNKVVAIYGMKNKILIFCERFLPRRLIRGIVARLQK